MNDKKQNSAPISGWQSDLLSRIELGCITQLLPQVALLRAGFVGDENIDDSIEIATPTIGAVESAVFQAKLQAILRPFRNCEADISIEGFHHYFQIGRASCRERGYIS